MENFLYDRDKHNNIPDEQRAMDAVLYTLRHDLDELSMDSAVRPIERLGAGQWLMPYDHSKYGIAVDFVITLFDGLVEVRARDHSAWELDAYYYKKTTPVLATWLHTTINDFTVWLWKAMDTHLQPYYDRLPKQYGEHWSRLSALTKWQELYKRMKAYNRLVKEDGFAEITLEEGNTLWNALKDLNDDYTLSLNDRWIYDLAGYCMADNDIVDETAIPKGTRILILRSTLQPLLPNLQLMKYVNRTVNLDKKKGEGAYQYIIDAFRQYYPHETSNEQLRVCLNAVLHLNSSIRPNRSVKATDYVYIPTKEYIDAYKTETAIVKKSVEKDDAVERSWNKTVEQALDYLLKHGRDGFMYSMEWSSKTRNEAVQKEKNYNYMKIKTMNLPVSTTNRSSRFTYILNTFAQYKGMPDVLWRIAPWIFLQETWCRNILKENEAKAKGIAQFTRKGWKAARYRDNKKKKVMPLYSEGRVDKRGDIVASIDATARSLVKQYNELKNNRDFITLSNRYWFTDEQGEILCSLMTINAHNSWPWHMQRALELAAWSEKSIVDMHIRKQGYLWLLFFITEDYAAGWREFQTVVSDKYASESPNYLYQVVKYATLYSSDPDYTHILWDFAAR